jgi:diguanylate cyclase (GGDEF)-like protein
MAAHVRIRILLAVAVAAICGGLFVVTEVQRSTDADSYAEYAAAQGLRSATLRMSLTVFVASDRGAVAAPEVDGAQRELERRLAEIAEHAPHRSARSQLQIRQQADAARELTQVATAAMAGLPGRDLKHAQRLALGRFLAPNDALLADLDAERKTIRRSAARRPVALVIFLCVVFGILHLLLVEGPARQERRRREAQREFGHALQLARSEPEVHALLIAHVARLIEAERVTVFDDTAGPLDPVTPETCLAIPMVVSGELMGSVVVEHPRPLRRRDREAVERSVAEAAPVVANLRNLEIAEMRAATDGLTGLANQRTVHDTLKRAAAQAGRALSPLSLVLFDLDHFKSINDTYGHGKGDEVLAAVGAVASNVIRSSDFVGRFGGEEFAVILPDTGRDGAVETAEKLRTAITTISVPGIDRMISASFGVAVIPDDAGDPDELFRTADRALYAAKHAGRNRVAVAANAL